MFRSLSSCVILESYLTSLKLSLLIYKVGNEFLPQDC